MARFDAGEPVTVPIGQCDCPGSPHEQDEVYIRPRLDYDGGAEAVAVMQTFIGAPVDQLARALTPVYIRHGAIGWNIVDADGVAVPFDVELLLSDWASAYEVGVKADDIYSEEVLRPLLLRASNSSPPTPISASTSRRKAGRGSRPKPSSRSSTTTSPMGVIVTTGNSPASAAS